LLGEIFIFIYICSFQNCIPNLIATVMEGSYSSMDDDQAFFLPMKMSIHMLCYCLRVQLSHI